MISSTLDFMSRGFLPPPPSGKTLPRLSQPQADTIIGYLSTSQAFELTLQTAFTPDEETALADFTLNPVLVFPFLSSQWVVTNDVDDAIDSLIDPKATSSASADDLDEYERWKR
jgi:hypothetical protein